MENKAIDAMVKKLDILYDKIFYFRDVIDCTNKEPKDWCTATEIQIYEGEINEARKKIREILTKHLKTLQPERYDVEISYKDTRTTTSDLELSRCKCGAAVGTLDTYCFSCGNKIKRLA